MKESTEIIKKTEAITRPEIGKIVKIKIDNIAFGGEGVGRVEGFVVFVPLVIEGEVVEAKIIEVKKSFARGELVKIINPSPIRINA